MIAVTFIDATIRQMQGMLNNPAFLSQMSGVMSDPAILDQVIASNPQLAAMGPQVRQLFQSDYFRNMMYVLCRERTPLIC